MKVEQMLTDALREEAEARDVDVTGLWFRTRERLGEDPDRRSRRTRRLTVLAAAAASLAVVAGVVSLAQVGGSREAGPAGADRAVEGGVDDEFTCPEQITHDWTRPESVSDPYFVASLRGGPAHQAKVHEAARYEFDEQGDRAYLRFGNADGTLGTLSEFRREGDEWVRFRTEVCVGEDGSIGFPERREWRLEEHSEPYMWVAGMPEDPATSSSWTLVDSRRYYDDIGLVRHRAIYAGLCGEKLCLRSGSPTEGSGYDLPAGVIPHDASSIFMPFDEIEERKNPYGFWVLYDADGVVESLTAKLRGKKERTTFTFSVDSWPGRLFAVLVPFDEVESVTVQRVEGADPGAPLRTTYTPEELPGYRAELHR